MEHRLILDAVRRNGLQLADADRKFQADSEIVLAAVQQNGVALQYASNELRSNKQIVLAAVSQDGSALADVFETSGLDDDTDVCIAAVQQAPWALQYCSERLKRCPQVVGTAVSIDAFALQYAIGDVLKSRQIIEKAIHNNGWAALCYADATIQGNEELVRQAIAQNSLALGAASDELRADKALVLYALDKAPHGLALMYADENLRDDKEVGDPNFTLPTSATSSHLS